MTFVFGFPKELTDDREELDIAEHHAYEFSKIYSGEGSRGRFSSEVYSVADRKKEGFVVNVWMAMEKFLSITNFEKMVADAKESYGTFLGFK